MDILFVFSGSFDSVRLIKFSKYLKSKGCCLSYIGWARYHKKLPNNYLYDNIKTILHGGGDATWVIPLMYVIWILKLFIIILFCKNINKRIIIAVNFESAFAIWLVSKFRKVYYVYDIWDELAISHNFPKIIKSILRFLDKMIRKSAYLYIHVDKTRYSDIDRGNENSIIIYNSPEDYYKKEENIDYKNKFAVTGWLNKTRGIQSIYNFALDNPEICFVIAGHFNQKEFEDKFLKLPNVDYHDFMSQEELFALIKDCRGIFSLYDPSIEINRLAASNKLYDAMMLSIPAIVNRGILAENFVKHENIGYVINYSYDDSWKVLCDFNPQVINNFGKNGRAIYKNRLEFNMMLDSILYPKLLKLNESI